MALTDFGTPARYSPPCPCGAPIPLRGPAGAKCASGHVSRFSLGPVGYLEWPVAGAWRYEPPPPAAAVWEATLEQHQHCTECGIPVHRGRTLDGQEHTCQPPVQAMLEHQVVRL